MPSSGEFASLTIRHLPYGEHHPYEHLPWERIPREPVSGETVTLGLVTNQSGKAENIWCVWKVVGDPVKYSTGAIKKSSNEGAESWEIKLPAFSGGQEIRYRLFARNNNQQVVTEEYSFIVSTWAKLQSLLSWEREGDRWAVVTDTDIPGLLVRVTFGLEPEGVLSVWLTTEKKDELQNSCIKHRKNVSAELNGIKVEVWGKPFGLALKRLMDGLVMQSREPIQVLVKAGGLISKYRLVFDSPSDEAFYGFGERFNAFDQRRNRLDNHVFAQYTDQGKRSYLPVPFFLSSRGYAVWLNTKCQAEFDLASRRKDRWSLTGCMEEDCSDFDLKFFFQENPKAIVQTFTNLTGKPKLPPSWAFGLWMSSNDWNSQSEIARQLDLATQHKIPASVMVIEAWSDEINFYIWKDARYQLKPSSQSYSLQDYTFPENGRWPNPQAIIKEIHRAGLRVVLWQIPVLKKANPVEGLDETQKRADEEYAIRKGYVVRKLDGSPYPIEEHAPWFPGGLVCDFTNPEARAWWFDKRKYLLSNMGIDGIKTDGGEHIWNPETIFHNGMTGKQGINQYPLSYLEAYHQFLSQFRGQDSILFSRAGYTGVQQFSCHWTGDENSTWEGFRANLRAILNSGLSGIAFMGWDMAGFAGDVPSAELYCRAVAFSTFCPFMQFHSDTNRRGIPSRDRTPWNIQERTGDSEVIPIFRWYANLRMNLIPYILNQAEFSSRTGIPLMRALPLEFSTDTECRKYPYEYLFGDSLLVAPVVEVNRSSLEVYLPEGKWRDFWTGRIFQGAQVFKVSTPKNYIPVFIRKGCLVPLNLGNDFGFGSPVGNSTEEVKNPAILISPGKIEKTQVFQGKKNQGLFISMKEKDPGGILQIDLEKLKIAADLLIMGVKPEQVRIGEVSIPEGNLESNLLSVFWIWMPERNLTRIHVPRKRESIRIFLKY